MKSPSFGTDREVVTTVAVTQLPKGINCVIGNSFYRKNPDLADIITVKKILTPQHENDLSVSARIDGLFSPPVISAQGSEGADTNRNLAADDLINSNSQHTLPLVHAQSELTQTAARPLSDAKIGRAHV